MLLKPSGQWCTRCVSHGMLMPKMAGTLPDASMARTEMCGGVTSALPMMTNTWCGTRGSTSRTHSHT